MGERDLVLFFVVAVANLNIVPVVASGGTVTVWLWVLALVLFFWPQGIAVIELSDRYPQEGGVYLWTKKLFGDFHGFLSGWCYWTNNIFYVPTLLLYVVGISVYMGGPRLRALGNDRVYVFVMALALLWLMVALNIRGLGVSKWVNNLGGVGTGVTAAVLMVLALLVVRRHGGTIGLANFRIAGADWHLINFFGVICFGLVGLELASVMGDEIVEPRRTVPRAVFWGGIASAALYVGATLAVLLAVPQREIGAVQGILQAVASMATKIGVTWLVPMVAFVLTIAIAGTTSAWLSGSARIPFVAGLDNYLPPALGRIHSKYATPYVALLVHAGVSCIFIAMSFVGATVEQAYKTLLLLAVVLQLVPFLYMYGGLIRLASRHDPARGYYRRGILWAAGLSGFLTTAVGMSVAFLPQESGEPAWLFELKMFLGCAFFLGLGAFFFFFYSRRAASTAAVARTATSVRGEGS